LVRRDKPLPLPDSASWVVIHETDSLILWQREPREPGDVRKDP
jgi:hypothetical protein